MITFTAVSSVLASKYYNHEKKAKKRQRKIEKKKNSTKNFNEMNQTERNGTERNGSNKVLQNIKVNCGRKTHNAQKRYMFVRHSI